MPLDILVIYEDDTKETFYAPLRMMRGEKENPFPQINRTVLEDWPWAQSNYSFTINKPIASIKAVVIDPSQLMADINQEDNVWQNIK